jgi:CubicO group peptidase (beta-lactamase class C family)
LRKTISILLLFSICITCITGFAQSKEVGGNGYYYPAEEWKVSTPEQQGMDSELLLKMFKLYGEKGRIIIIRNGFMVTDYDQSYLKNDIHHIHSCTKSIISALIGVALQDGYLKNLDQKVLSFFPDYKKIENLDLNKKKVTLYHLLTMSSGMKWCDNPNIDSNQMNESSDWIQYILDRPMLEEPGQIWNYNSGGSQLLSIILQKTTKVSAEDYAKEKLFQPLGINKVNWWKSPQGYSTAGWGLHLSSFDITKISYLFLREGQWGNQQVIPSGWVSKSTEKHFIVKNGFGNGFSYGYQWWVYNGLPYYAYKAWGSFAKHAVMMIVVPKLDMVVVLAGNNKNDSQLLKLFIIPSVKSSKSITPKPEIAKELMKVIELSSK